ncbi:MAG TPA: endolytic transglycosylase MltG [Gammaproteobacteria bacterium]|nr:endolytic transglycosylase MltG [Gammaproteobacteria bacterium]
MFKRFRGYITFLVLAVVGISAIWIQFLLTPLVSNPAGVRYQLFPGTSLKTFAESLHQEGLVKHPTLLILLARMRGDTQQLKAGIYLIQKGTTPSHLLDQVTTGSGLLYKVFTIVPGWTFQQLREALSHADKVKHTIDKMNDKEIMAALGDGNLSPEGQFFPDTYYYMEETSDIKLLSRAYKRMRGKFQQAWDKRDPHIMLNPQEVLIAASLVEKETHLNSERPVIAGVLFNRLQNKMLLQFDPAVAYGVMQRQITHPGNNLGFNGILRKQDLKMDTPYNTYLHKGLPPTPIAIPSIDAINAVLHPVLHSYLYFVATGNGGHQFSQTLEEHNLAVVMAKHNAGGFFNYMLVRNYILKRFASTLRQIISPLSPQHQIGVRV